MRIVRFSTVISLLKDTELIVTEPRASGTVFFPPHQSTHGVLISLFVPLPFPTDLFCCPTLCLQVAPLGLHCFLDLGWIWPMAGTSRREAGREDRREIDISLLHSLSALVCVSWQWLYRFTTMASARMPSSGQQFSLGFWTTSPSLYLFRSRVIMAPHCYGYLGASLALLILPAPLQKSLH